MLLSMTGFGEAHRQEQSLAVTAEVRTINNRYFKLSIRCDEGYATLEPRIEALVRQHIKRGTVQVTLRVEHARKPDDYRVNVSVLAGYHSQLEAVRSKLGGEPVNLSSLLSLPGVIDEERRDPDQVETDGRC